MSKNYYFSHDYNARNDAKLQEVMMKMGLEGLGIYWCLVEMMFEQDGKLRLDKCDSYAFTLRTDCDKIKSLIDLIFEHDEIYFWSSGVLKRIEKIEEKSSKAKQSAQMRWGKDNANALPTQSEGNAIKERKEKKRNNIYSSKKSLTDELCKEIAEQYSVEVGVVIKTRDNLVGWCEAKGKSFKNYRSALQNWIRRGIDEKKINKLQKSVLSGNKLPEISEEQRLLNLEKLKEIKSRLL